MVSMDVYKVEQLLHKEVLEETRPPLGPSEKNIVVARKPKSSREVSSRYKSAITSNSPSAPVVPRRCPSPNLTRVVPAATPLYTKRAQSAERVRAQSAERVRPSSPSATPRQSTPVHHACPEIQSASKRLPGARFSEGLWPSGTMRSLCVSFQSDTISIPITKREKPVNQASSDHTLKPSANMGHRQAETPHVQRKATPERKRTPLRGRNASDQLENSRPMDNSHDRTIEHHRWPSRTGGKTSTNPSTRSLNLTDKPIKTLSSPLTGRGVSPLRRSPGSDVQGKGLLKARSEVANILSSDESGRGEHGLNPSDALRSSGPKIGVSSNSSERSTSTVRASKSQSLPVPGSRPPSPSRTSLISTFPARGTLSPSRTRPSAAFPSASAMANQSINSSSILNFLVDHRKGKRGVNHIEDAHQLRLLHNRYLQWRYANAQADITLSNQRIATENNLYNVWNTTSDLLGSVTIKRINLQQLRQELKLDLVLTEQMTYLEDWALLEKEHSSSLSEAIDSLEACTLRLPVTSGAKVDTHSLKSAVCSAADVMESMASSICALLSRVGDTNNLVSELAEVTALEKAMIYECADLLASTAAMQVEENSLRSHLIQMKETVRKEQQPIPIILTPV